MQFSMTVVGVKPIADAWAADAASIEPRVKRELQLGGNQMVRAVRARASGRPGPRAVTGAYRASWQKKVGQGSVTIGTNSPQGRRLELGFHGADRIGRHYNQPPYPHVGPAFDATAPKFQARILALVEEIR